MSRHGGKRKHVVQLGNTSSKLHRYGYSKQLHSGDVPKLVGDYPDSDSEDEEDEQIVEGQNGGTSGLHDDALPSAHADGQKTDREGGQGDMDDELRNFLSEIEAIPMPPDTSEKQGNGTIKATETPANQITESDEESEKPPEKKASQSGKPNQYSMFVKGDTEFVHSPSQLPSADHVTDAGDTAGLDDLPEEPVTSWQMVQDEATQYFYYWNYQTNEVTWEIPNEYTQYLLLHKEYTDKLAKLTPDQLKAVQARNAELSSASNSTSQLSKDSALSSALTSDQRSSQHHTDHSKNEEQSSRHRHEKKKKKKRHKRKYSDDNSSEDERPARDPQPSQKVEIGPAPKPASPEVSKAPASGLLSIVPYASDQEDEEEEEQAQSESVPSKTNLPFAEDADAEIKESEDRLPDTAAKGSLSEVKMPDLSAPVTPQMSPETMPELSPAFIPAPDLPLPSADLPGLLADSEKQEPSEDPYIPSLTSQEVKSDTSDDCVKQEDGSVTEADIPKADTPSDTLEKGADVEEHPSVEKEQSVVQTLQPDKIEIEKVKKSVKKKEVLDMFAEDFPITKTEETFVSVPTSEEDTVNGKDSKISASGMEAQPEAVEEGEIVSTAQADVILKGESNQKSERAVDAEKKNKNNSRKQKSSVIPDKEKTFGVLNALASYGTEEEEEEGEVVEQPVVKPKKKNKEKRKDGKEKRSYEKGSSSHAKDEKNLALDKSSGHKSETFVVPAVEPPVKEAVKVAAEPMEDTSVDIDPEDIDDIDRALERALEKKLEQKMVELDSYSKNETSKDSSPSVPSGAEKNGHHDNENAPKLQSTDSETLSTEVKEIAELALSKLEFLDITTDNLSRLQVLLIELQTRMSDWSAGGLSTEYFLQQLRVAEGLLDQYEASAVPHGWACQWDRAINRYYYRNLATNRIQWEYPETETESGKPSEEQTPVSADKSRAASEEEKKPRSSSSRHRKREEKDRSKYDKRGSSRRHRRKRHRRRDHSSSSDVSEEETASRHSSTSRHHHKSKKKKRRRSEVRSPSVEVIGREAAKDSGEVVEIPEDDDDSPVHIKTQPSASLDDRADSDDSQSKPDEDQNTGQAENEINVKKDGTEEAEGGDKRKEEAAEEEEEDVDGEAMEEEQEEEEEDGEEQTASEEVNTAVISKPPQIIKPPEIAALQPPQLYSAPSVMAAPPSLSAAPEMSTGTSEVKPDPSTETAEAKKKKKDKKSSSSSSSLLMKKKHMSSMVQKWQRVKKEVEKEDRAKEMRQAAIRQKISELK